MGMQTAGGLSFVGKQTRFLVVNLVSSYSALHKMITGPTATKLAWVSGKALCCG